MGIDKKEDLSAARILHLRREYGHLEGLELLRVMIGKEFRGQIVLSSSFGIESGVLLYLVSKIDADVPIVFLDTGKLFKSTYAYCQSLISDLGLRNLEIIGPDYKDLSSFDKSGLLWSVDPDICCEIRKVNPLKEFFRKRGYRAWISGRKRFQGGSRKDLEVIEAQGSLVKINPLAYWDKEKLEKFYDRNNIRRHPLWFSGYSSVGCASCTLRNSDINDIRAGRWAGRNKTECGIHKIDWE